MTVIDSGLASMSTITQWLMESFDGRVLGNLDTPHMYSSPPWQRGNDVADQAERWEQLFAGLDEFSLSETPTELQVAQLNRLLGSVRLIQPFNWTSWSAPFPATGDIATLSLADCIKHITRLSRADRTNEGILWGSLRAGILGALCHAAQLQSAGQSIGVLADLESRH